jgi:uncharacterized membrane protein YqjE
MATASSAPPPLTAIQTRPSADVARVEESTASIVRGAITDVGDIIKAEIALAKIEISEDAKALARTLPIGSAGIVLALLGTALVLHAVALGLGVVLPAWAAYLLTAAVAIGGGAAMIFYAIRRLKDWKSFVPERTIASLEENEQWIRRKLS